MLSFPPTVRIFLCTRPVDFRAAFDRLAALVRQHLQLDPLCGHLFVFRNKRGDRLKILYWDRDGFALWYKRLEQGTFVFPTDRSVHQSQGDQGLEINSTDLAMLLDGVDVSHIQRQQRYRRTADA